MPRELTQQEKIVFKELCIRAFYGVKVQTSDNLGNRNYTLTGYRKTAQQVYHFYTNERYEYEPRYLNSGCYDSIKPYLFPISKISSLITAKELSTLSGYELIDWYNTNHIDYRGLIEKGLAIEAITDMYNN